MSPDQDVTLEQKKLKRYDLVTNYRCGSTIEEMERNDDDGEWVRYEDVEAALVASREAQTPAWPASSYKADAAMWRERALRAESTWQLIETAPKDGSWFLAWNDDLGCFVYRNGPGLIAGEEPEPTHWMPLPSPPVRASRRAPAATPQDGDERECPECKGKRHKQRFLEGRWVHADNYDWLKEKADRAAATTPETE